MAAEEVPLRGWRGCEGGAGENRRKGSPAKGGGLFWGRRRLSQGPGSAEIKKLPIPESRGGEGTYCIAEKVGRTDYTIQIGTMKFSPLMAESSGRIQSTAPVPRGTEPLSRTEKAPISSLPGLTERFTSKG